MFAGPPQRPMDLRYYDLTHDSVHLEWLAGFDMGSIQHFLVLRVYDGVTVVVSDILTGKRNATTILSGFICGSQTRAARAYHGQNHKKALGSFESIDFCLSGMLANIHEYCNYCHKFYFLLSNLSNILHAAFLSPVSIFSD